MSRRLTPTNEDLHSPFGRGVRGEGGHFLESHLCLT